ncbi:MFS transporter [Streptomyces sp. NBC_00829]|uniref:MFS transporter n=1 Tax=Streptomyces sp. NBC_00829 TaxID=2903679 RepID=UPI003866B416|nr:MFS transporter [Streptomyces sp. NBC_00829]
MDRAAPGALKPHPRLTRRSSFALDASILVALLAASSAPTPLYAIYQDQWGFSSLTLTVIFSAYSMAMLLALLMTGSLSDHLGRRPVLVGALAVEASAMALIAAADGVGQLLLARVLQGLATGLATSAVGAALLELEHPRRAGSAALTNSVAPMAGMAIGVLGSTFLVQCAPAPGPTVHLALLGVFVLQSLALLFTSETARRRPGALRSLRPTVRVPASARKAMLIAAPGVVAVWSLGGFTSSLGPGLARLIDPDVPQAIGGLLFFTLTTSAVLAVWAVRRLPATTPLLLGAGAVLPGVGLILLSVQVNSLTALFAGTALAGVGFGAVSQGALRTVLPRVATADRASTLAAYYVLSYLAMSLPTVLAGLLTVHYGLLTTTLVFGATVAAAGTTALAVVLRGGRMQTRRSQATALPQPGTAGTTTASVRLASLTCPTPSRATCPSRTGQGDFDGSPSAPARLRCPTTARP